MEVDVFEALPHLWQGKADQAGRYKLNSAKTLS